jgi:hypothetical protein
MGEPQEVDYDALAQKHGAEPAVDYDALAKHHGAIATPPEESWLHRAFTPRSPLSMPGAKPFHSDSPLPGSSEGAGL